jgi:hypothetical protein
LFIFFSFFSAINKTTSAAQKGSSAVIAATAAQMGTSAAIAATAAQKSSSAAITATAAAIAAILLLRWVLLPL